MMKGRRSRRGVGEMVEIGVLLFSCILVWNPSLTNADTNSDDVSALNVLYTSLNSPSKLTSWKANGGDPCGQSWLGITCSGSAVTAIKLPGMGLTGTLGYNMNIMTSLTEIDLSNNNLGSGTQSNQIPYNLPPNLQRINLAQNQFRGNIPYSISQMSSLRYLNLGHNQLQDALGDVFNQLSNLVTMLVTFSDQIYLSAWLPIHSMWDLSFNAFSGDLPQSFSTLSSLTTLFLQSNQFTGYINVLADLPLKDLDVSNNRFTGWIPNKLKKINNLRTDGNSWSSGPAPPPPPYTPPPVGRPTKPDQQSDGGGKSGIGGGGIAGIIISILVVGGIVAFFLIKRRKRKTFREEIFEQEQPFNPLDEPKGNLKPPPKIEVQKSFNQDDFQKTPVPKKTIPTAIKASSYSVADLQMATDSFNIDNLVGEGSFGRVYKAQFNNEKVLAVKKIDHTALPSQSSEDFLELVSNISHLHHPNLTELVGYCSEHGQHLLVYEFHMNGSLHDLLHLSDEYSKPLSWNTRVKIALGSARALEYLHEVCSPSIIHKNFKSSNILIDTELNPRLSDSGFASLVPSREFQASDQNLGYSAPEVAMSDQYSQKSDIYSFGVVMLEILTGRKPFDSSRPRSEQSLVQWATPQLHDIDALDRMIDPALKGLYPEKSVSRFADVIALCVQSEPEFRPPMSEVVQALVRLVQRANMSKQMFGGNGQGTSRRADDVGDFL
ncbi:protein STRUBBELIG-RECEPTOR FAMILY 7-like isoform X2 [Typha latifolia]|uniref:protein STRUBBELIG-RECEPTOR FAMILY 7-like isoform X2 n=1 Tax=Typha latifolia TaxID=4733 RepID=UPI003C2D45E2